MINYEIKAENAAQKDLDKKLEAEETFKRELAALFALMSRDFRVIVSRTGIAPDATDYTQAFTQLLKKHYNRVQSKFKGQVIDFNNLNISPELQDEINFLLLEWSNNTAPQQAVHITQTNQKNMQESISKAIEQNMDDGMAFNNRLVAATGAALLRKKFKGRVDRIAVFETQNSAENTKAIESQSLQRSRIARMIKIWITIGDRIVRATHNAVNRQKRRLEQAFNVGGAKLMQPGDTSLGAPAKETQN